MYSILQPALKTNNEKENVMSLIKPRIMNEISDNLTTVTVDTKDVDLNADCIKFEIPSEVIDSAKSKFMIWDKNSANLLNFKLENGYITTSINAFKIYFSDSLVTPSETFGCDPAKIVVLTSDKLRFKTESEIFENKIVSRTSDSGLINQTDNPEKYDELKSRIGLDKIYNFAIKFDATNMEYVTDNFENPSVSAKEQIYVEESLIKYIDNNANVKYGTLQIKLW